MSSRSTAVPGRRPRRFKVAGPPPPGAILVGGRPAGGWTDLPLAPGARQVFVRADGDDGNAGDVETRPVRSLGRALSLLRPDAGDRLRLFAGHAFAGGLGQWRWSGRPGCPAGVMAYGDAGERPVLAVARGDGVTFDAAGVHDVAFVGLHLTAAGRAPPEAASNRPAAVGCGVTAAGPVRRVLLEDCRIDRFRCNVRLGGRRRDDQGLCRQEDVVIRRCLLTDAWAAGEDAAWGHGIHAEHATGLLVTECVLDHNGWAGARPGWPEVRPGRHGLYAGPGTSGVTFERNLCARAGGCGARLTAGGTARGNVFLYNGTAAVLGGNRGAFADNLVVGHEATRWDPGWEPRAAVFAGSRSAEVAGNVFLGWDDAAGEGCPPPPLIEAGRRVWTAAGPRAVRVAGNVVRGCCGAAVRVSDPAEAVAVTGNVFQDVGQDVVAVDRPVRRFHAADNLYDGSGRGVGPYFGHHSAPGLALSPSEWAAATGDRSKKLRVRFADPGWRLPAGLIGRARDRERGCWDRALAADSILAEARAAFAPA
jgi:hypothetical protein